MYTDWENLIRRKCYTTKKQVKLANWYDIRVCDCICKAHVTLADGESYDVEIDARFGKEKTLGLSEAS